MNGLKGGDMETNPNAESIEEFFLRRVHEEQERAEKAEENLQKSYNAIQESLDIARRTEWDVDPEIQMILKGDTI